MGRPAGGGEKHRQSWLGSLPFSLSDTTGCRTKRGQYTKGRESVEKLRQPKPEQMMFAVDHSQTQEPVMSKKDSALIREMKSQVKQWCKQLKSLPLEAQVEALNAARLLLHAAGPFASEPVDCVQWVKNSAVQANDYNPNSVAPPEMELLRLSISADGYTQPIVSWNKDKAYEVVDGFHRHRVGKECEDVRQRVSGYLPLVVIKSDREDKADRMAATIRHNRARGKHRVDAMSEIVVDLKRRRWSDEKIGKELGMDPDEVLRLTQVSGLAELFADRDFSEAWEADRIEEELDEG
jgi:ParB-like chromosome segregation protein Spo0J